MTPGWFDPPEGRPVPWAFARAAASLVCTRSLCGPGPLGQHAREQESAVYAIVRAGGRQEKVAVGDVFEIDRLAG